jgi:hypothetical protein
MKIRATTSACLAVLTATLLLMTSAPGALASSPIAVHDDKGFVATPGPAAAAPACVLEPGPVALFAYVYDLPDYFTSVAGRIPRQLCTTCPSPNVLNLRTVSCRVRFLQRAGRHLRRRREGRSTLPGSGPHPGLVRSGQLYPRDQ